MVKELFDYDSETGLFTKVVNEKYCKKGNIIKGYINKKGYCVFDINKSKYFAHRLAYAFVYGDLSELYEIDHIDRNRSNNKISNLRLVTAQENQFNYSIPRHNTSGYLGVSYRKERNKYQAKIKFNKKTIHLGYYKEAKEAHNAYLIAKSNLHIIEVRLNE